jgi:hypothetical protein
MLRKMMLALVAIAFLGALAASTTADARWSGRGLAGRPSFGPRRIEFRPGFNRFGFRRIGFARTPFVGSRRLAFHPGFPRFNRFGSRQFRVAVAPFAVGVGIGLYGGPCWGWQPTPWGWQQVWFCGGGVSYGGGYDGGCGYGDF